MYHTGQGPILSPTTLQTQNYGMKRISLPCPFQVLLSPEGRGNKRHQVHQSSLLYTQIRLYSRRTLFGDFPQHKHKTLAEHEAGHRGGQTLGKMQVYQKLLPVEIPFFRLLYGCWTPNTFENHTTASSLGIHTTVLTGYINKAVSKNMHEPKKKNLSFRFFFSKV